jgi:hypothetical protein
MCGMLFSYLEGLHSPSPHNVVVAIAAPPAATEQLQQSLDTTSPGGFELLQADNVQDARNDVLDHTASAAYAPAPNQPQLYGAKADGASLEAFIRTTFTAVAQRTGGNPQFQELVPTAPGDVVGTSTLYVLMACALPAYFMVSTMQRAVGFGRVAHLLTIFGFGAAISAISFLVAAYGMNVIPRDGLNLLYMFMLAEAVSLTSYGMVPFFGQFFPGVASALFVTLSTPTSGSTVATEMIPGFFRWLHPVLPMGNAADAVRLVSYFHGTQLTRPTAVLVAWISVGCVLIVLGYVKQLRAQVRDVAAGASSLTVPAPEDPTLQLPSPVALSPHRHHSLEEAPMLTGIATDPDGRALPEVTITVSNAEGHRLVRTYTDENGAYAATGFRDQLVVILASAPGYQPDVARLMLTLARPVNQNLVLAPAFRSLNLDDMKVSLAHDVRGGNRIPQALHRSR